MVAVGTHSQLMATEPAYRDLLASRDDVSSAARAGPHGTEPTGPHGTEPTGPHGTEPTGPDGTKRAAPYGISDAAGAGHGTPATGSRPVPRPPTPIQAVTP